MDNFNSIYKGGLLDFSEFREEKVTKAILTSKKSKASPFNNNFTSFIYNIIKQGRVVDRTLQTENIQLYFAKYIKELVNLVDSHLKDKDIQLENVGYVVTVEKLISNNFLMESRIDLSKFIKKNTRLNIIVVDQGEKEVHCMLQRTQLKPPSFYVHANIEDSYIFMKLHQVVDTTSANGGIAQQSTVVIKDKKILVTHVQEQVCQKMWNHIHSLDEIEKEEFIRPQVTGSSMGALNDFENFKEALTFLIKEKVEIQLRDHQLLKPVNFSSC